MAMTTPEMSQALAVACLNQESFVKELIADFKGKKPTVGKGAKLWGEMVGEFYQGVFEKVNQTFHP